VDSRLFLIGFYSIRIWESRLRSLSISSVSSDSSGSGRETSKSKRGKQKEREGRREKVDRLARETALERKLSVSVYLFSSSKKIPTQSILRGPRSSLIDVVSPGGRLSVCLWRVFHPLWYLTLSPDYSVFGWVGRHYSTPRPVLISTQCTFPSLPGNNFVILSSLIRTTEPVLSTFCLKFIDNGRKVVRK
jgi:hypothetical protein